MSARIDAEALLKLRPHQEPEGYAGHDGDAYVRLTRFPNSVVTSAEARAWATLLLTAAEEADDAVEEQERNREADRFSGEPDAGRYDTLAEAGR